MEFDQVRISDVVISFSELKLSLFDRVKELNRRNLHRMIDMKQAVEKLCKKDRILDQFYFLR